MEWFIEIVIEYHSPIIDVVKSKRKAMNIAKRIGEKGYTWRNAENCYTYFPPHRIREILIYK